MSQQPTVFVVDDDPAVRKGIKFLVKSVDLNFEEFPSAMSFLDSYDHDKPGCLILDMRMPEMGGLDLQQELNKRNCLLPIIILTGHGNVQASVTALKAGAFDFIEKPPQDHVLLDIIQKAIRKDAQNRADSQKQLDNERKLASLSKKELIILKMIAQGLPNKAIAYDLELSEKTIEYHRAKIMKALNATCVQELMVFAIEAGIHQDD